MKNEPFYSSGEWNIIASKTNDPKVDDECGWWNEPCVDKNTCANAESNVESDYKCFLVRNVDIKELR